jgi:trimeric autotransporter adhesin
VLHAPIWGEGRRATVWILVAVVAACGSASTDVVTTADVGSVSITPTTTTVRVGSQIPLQALVQDPDGNTIPGTDVFWSVQNPSIATISSTGIVTGVALGSTQVAASVNGKSGIAAITVSQAAVATVTVTPSPLSMSTGQTRQLAATVKDQNGTVVTNRVVTWTSSNPAVATVAGGVVSGFTTGTAIITATSEGKSGTASVTVTQVPVGSVTVSPSNPSLSKNESVVLQATLKDASNAAIGPGRVVTWTASDNGMVTLTPTAGTYSATLKGKKAGTVTITATSEGKTGTTTVTVKN